jgi:hypothetical protein
MKLGVIVERNASWVRERDVGLVLRNFRGIARMRANAAAQSNRAVFEIPDILESILGGVS